MMNKMLYAVCSLALAALMVFRTSKEEVHSFVQQRDGQFLIGRQPYKFVGTNFWYGAILGSEGQGGDRQRLCRELDNLHALGLDNLRILVYIKSGMHHVASHFFAPFLEGQSLVFFSSYNLCGERKIVLCPIAFGGKVEDAHAHG